jgi:serine/threonine protein kinase/tetratricopeptide (TPR) repeat protein
MRFQSGDLLGPYEIVAPLGAGGMGEVYRARDPRLGREVAIKVLPEHLARNPEYRQRFEREARAVAALSHPNIVAIHDVGEHRGSHFVVTELLEGQTLRARLAGGAIEWREAAALGAALAEGVAAAHAKGITHRDLKPENVFVTADGRVKVLDFGLARREPPLSGTEETAAGAMQTQAGTVLGTIGYMSPEQARGEPATPASDVFAIGCVLYEMFSGRKAFVRATVVDSLAAILREEPPALTSLSPVPAALAATVVRCLEKEPARRPASAREVAAVLRSTPSATEASAAEPADSLAVLPFASVGGPDAEYLGDGIAESLINAFSRFPDLRVVPRSAAFRHKNSALEPSQIGRELRARLLLSGRVVERGGRLSVQVELVDAAADKQIWGERFLRDLSDIFAVEEEISRQIAEKLRVKLAGGEKRGIARGKTSNPEAYQLYLKGRYQWARRTPESLQRAREYFVQALERDPNYAMAYVGLVDALTVLTYYGVIPGDQACPEILSAARRAVEVDPALPEGRSALGWSLMFDLDWAGSEREFQAALKLDPDCVHALDWFGLMRSAQGRTREAAQLLARARALEPVSLVLMQHTAWISVHDRRYDDAVAECGKALELDPHYLPALLWRAVACQGMGRHEEALEAVQKASALSKLWNLHVAQALAAAGRTEDARRMMASELQSPAPVDPYQAALAYAALGEREAAFEWLEKGVARRSLFMLTWIRNDPRVNSLRDDPRFAAVLRRLGLQG